MLATPGARLRYLLVAAILTLPLSGCSPSNLFQGRLFIINSTGGVLRSPTVINSHPGLDQKFEFPDMADRQAWVRDCGGDNPIVVLGDLKLTYIDRSRETRTRSVPFQGEIPDYCDDDFFIEIDHDDQLRWGMLVYRNYSEHYYVTIETHTLAGATGLLLGWMFWRKGRGRTIRPGRPEKSAIDPDIG
jgi:hypothetical protein